MAKEKTKDTKADPAVATIGEPAQPEGGTPAAGEEGKGAYTEEQLTTIVTAAVEKATAEARNEEKSKLYDTLEKQKDDLKGMKEFVDGLKTEKQEAEEAAEAERVAKMTETQVLQTQVVELSGVVKGLTTKMQEERDDWNRQMAQKTLDDHRQKLILEHKGGIIAELIQGSTIEEIDASLEYAKSRFNEIVEQAKQTVSDQEQQQAQHTAPKPTKITQIPSNENSPSTMNNRSISSLDKNEVEKMKDAEVSKFMNGLK